ncbi:branched-chain amino acid transport system II carrier protein [Mesobacillus foraminis]|uniref:branched-chain amino acid transport system II carrier protein n=1 Tax=Mesobacillus foraminis TaxID=279826 RepID=UPI0039A0332B
MINFSRKDLYIIGLMLFALFFGAGNLIFPPFLGFQAGESFWPAILGFVVTGVGLPLVTVLAIAMTRDGVAEMGKRVSPLFSVVFSITAYLSIGPFFGIPRGANVAYEMSIKPFLGNSPANTWILLLFSVVFFSLVYWVCLNPSKLVERIGSILTPLLLGAIALLVLGSLYNLDGKSAGTAGKFASAPFAAGFLEGYLTMDTIAALAFGIIVINSIREKGVTDKATIARLTLKAGLIAGGGLALVYIGLGLLGTKMPGANSYENGVEILTESANLMFGPFGMVLLGLIVTLACFTTCVGLVAACGQFFSKLFPKVSYLKFATIITMISFCIANLGLNQIITISVPVLTVIYPITIVLVLLSLADKYFGGKKSVYIGAVSAALIISVLDAAMSFGMNLPWLHAFLHSLPLYSEGLGWLVPTIIGGTGGYLLNKLTKTNM